MSQSRQDQQVHSSVNRFHVCAKFKDVTFLDRTQACFSCVLGSNQPEKKLLSYAQLLVFTEIIRLA